MVCSNCENTAAKPTNASINIASLVDFEAQYSCAFRQNLQIKTCLFPGLFNASGASPKNLTLINNMNCSHSLYVDDEMIYGINYILICGCVYEIK